jgi:beta-lactamase regulating signal transducer with metallopeptidase domain
MTAAWAVYVLAVGTLLAIGAELSASASRHFGRPTRFAFAAALAGILALAVVAPRPEAVDRSLPVGIVTATAPATHTEQQRTLVDRLRAARAMLGDEAIALSDAMQRRVSPMAARIVFVAWVGVSATLFLLFVLVNRRLTRARRSWPSHSLHGTAVRVAPGLGPAVLGFLRAEIVVPRSLLERSDEDQRLILAHEREHLWTGDHLLLGGAWLCAIAFPWHPAVWYLTNRVRLAIELDCDARVLRGGASPRSYGALLIDMAARQSAVRIGALALVDGPSHLERRILAMNAIKGRHALARGVALAAAGGLLVLAACEARVPTSAEIAQMDVAGAQRSAAEGGFLRTPSKVGVDYFVNGVRVNAEQARALEARQIGSIEVVKSELPTGRDTIFVTTLDRMRRPALKSDPAEAARYGGSEYSFDRKRMSDSTEKMVAHVERELAAVRADESKSREKTRRPSMRRTSSAGEPAPTITIDGKIATEAQLAALDERDIASIAVYKGNEGQLLLRSKGGEHLEATSGPAPRSGAKESSALIAVTTKIGRQAQSTRP